MAESRDDEQIAGDYSEVPEGEGDFDDDLSVGTPSDSGRSSLFATLRSAISAFLSPLFRSGRPGSAGLSVDDEPEESDLANRKSPSSTTGESRFERTGPGSIEVRAVRREIGPYVSSTGDRSRVPASDSPAGDQAQPTRGTSARRSAAGSRSDANPAEGLFRDSKPHEHDPSVVEDFILEKEDFLIAGANEHARKFSLRAMLGLPLAFFRFLTSRKSRPDWSESVDDVVDRKSAVFDRRQSEGRRNASVSDFGAHSELSDSNATGGTHRADSASRPGLIDQAGTDGVFDRSEPIDDEGEIVIGRGSPSQSVLFDKQLVSEGQKFESFPAPDDFVIGTDEELGSFDKKHRDDAALQQNLSAKYVADQGELQSYSAASVGIRDRIRGTIRNIWNFSLHLIQRLESNVSSPGDLGSPLSSMTVGSEGLGNSADLPSGTTFSHLRGSIARLVRWSVGIPLRSLTRDGDIFDQKRSVLELILASIPAVLAAIFVFSQVSHVNDTDLLSLNERYVGSFRKSTADKDTETARLAAARACGIQPIGQNHFYWASHLANSTSERDTKLGFRLMEHLASPEGRNQADAHLFLADVMMLRTSEDPKLRRQIYGDYLTRLRIAFAAAPTRYDILERLADSLMSLGDEQSLSRLLTPYLSMWPIGHYYLAQSAFLREDRVIYESHALALVRYFRNLPAMLDSDAKNQFRYAVGLAMTGDEDAAQAHLASLDKKAGSDPILVQVIKDRLTLIKTIRKLDDLPEGSDQDVEELGKLLLETRLSLELKAGVLRLLLKKGPLRQALVDLGMKIYRERKESLDADDCIYWASIMRQNGKNAEAREMLEQSIQLNSENPIAANNLANLLYKEEPKDYERALALIDSVLKNRPDEAMFLETRGQILSLMGRDKDAIRDLVRCLPQFPNVPEIHETLARCYRRIGDSKSADYHQSHFDELKSKAAAQAIANPPSPKS